VESAENQDASTTARQRLLDLTNNKLKRDLSSAHVTDLSTQMCLLDLDQQATSGESSSSSSSAKLRSDMEKSSRFYAQLYKLLGKRKQLPLQHANFDVLSEFDDVTYTKESEVLCRVAVYFIILLKAENCYSSFINLNLFYYIQTVATTMSEPIRIFELKSK
jgi:hypothetical protein